MHARNITILAILIVLAIYTIASIITNPIEPPPNTPPIYIDQLNQNELP